jgi:hypothetical protein
LLQNFFVAKLNYLCKAFGIHPILCVWGLTFKEEAIELPPFRYGRSYNKKRDQSEDLGSIGKPVEKAF